MRLRLIFLTIGPNLYLILDGVYLCIFYEDMDTYVEYPQETNTVIMFWVLIAQK